MTATCLGCGCACDDIELGVEANRIVEARHACPLGVRWFGDGGAPSRMLVRGRDASAGEALEAAAGILDRSSRALVYLAPDISCEAQRAAIAIADALHAFVDSVTSATAMASVLAAQEGGRASATLGEIRNRADVVLFWGVEPSSRYPRFWARYAPEPRGLHVAGRGARTVVAVDVGGARGPGDADLRMMIAPEREVAALTELTAAVAGEEGGPRHGHAHRPAGGTDLGRVLDALLRATYVAIVADAEPDDDPEAAGDAGRSAALTQLAQALNGPTRCALVTLRAGGNRSGADACLTSQTGYPMAVDFSAGYPRYRPHDGAAARLDRRAVDAVLVAGDPGGIPAPLARTMSGLPAVVIGPRASGGPFPHAEVVVDTAVAGIHEAGTALRMDDVPLPLAGAIAGPPPAADTLAALAARLARPLHARRESAIVHRT